jgi:hypothetical protein
MTSGTSSALRFEKPGSRFVFQINVGDTAISAGHDFPANQDQASSGEFSDHFEPQQQLSRFGKSDQDISEDGD